MLEYSGWSQHSVKKKILKIQSEDEKIFENTSIQKKIKYLPIFLCSEKINP
jgi:hypothetical protein